MHTKSIAVGIVGPSGRMGRRLCDLLLRSSTCHLAATLSRAPNNPLPQQTPNSRQPVSHCTDQAAFVDQPLAVVVDFSAPPVVSQLAPLCARHGIAYVLGSTGLSSLDQACLAQVSEQIPTLYAANFSLGIAVLEQLARIAATALPAMDMEILDIHHRHKRDAPSGTALLLANALAQASSQPTQVVAGRGGMQAPRQAQEIGMAALRGGEVIGEHQIHFLGDHEQLCLTHRAVSLDVFADGALRAAAWLVGKPPGNYALQDMLAAPLPQ